MEYIPFHLIKYIHYKELTKEGKTLKEIKDIINFKEIKEFKDYFEKQNYICE